MPHAHQINTQLLLDHQMSGMISIYFSVIYVTTVTTVCGTETENDPKICFYSKNLHFYAIITKLDKNKQLISTIFLPSFIMIA